MSAQNVLKNAIWLLIVRIVMPVTSLLTFVFASRLLRVDEVGKYSLILAFFQISQLLPLLGMNAYIVREVSKNKESAAHFLSNMSLIGLVLSAFLGMIFYGVGFCLHYPADVMTAIGVLFGIVVLTSFTLVADAVFMGFERMEFSSLIGIGEGIARLIASVYCLYAGFGFVSLIWVMLIFRVVAVFLYALSIWHVILEKRFFFKFSKVFIRQLISASKIFIGTSLCSTILSRVDFVLLSKIKDFSELGFYTAAYRILETIVLFTTVINFSAFPLLSRLHQSSESSFKETARRLVKYMAIASFLIAGLMIIYAEPVIELIYSKRYAPSVVSLQILALALIFMSLDQVLAAVFVASNKQALDLAVLFRGVLIYIAFLFWLIPPLGFYGASLATAASMAIQLIIRWAYLNKNILKMNLVREMWKPLFAVLTALVLAQGLHFIPWVAAALIMAGVYFGLLFLLKVIDSNDFSFLTEIRYGKKAERQL